jgi:hypothetical protein
MDSWRIWLAIVLLVDASVGLLGISRFEKIISPRILTRLAIAEAVVAVCLVVWHFTL